MRVICLANIVALVLSWSLFARIQDRVPGIVRQPAPVADHHQHLFSAELATLMSTPPPVASAKPRSAADLIQQLAAAGITRAVVLSTAYIFEQPSRKADAAADKVRRDNDWTS